MTGSRCFYFEGLIQLCRWLRVDVHESLVERPKPRWLQWGFRYRTRTGRPDAWYILIRLPSYQFKPTLYTQEPGWHQLCLYFFEPIPAGPGGWRFEEIELPHG